MDHQSLTRVHGMFCHVPPDSISPAEAKWLEPISGVPKVDFKAMMKAIESGAMDLWRLEDGPEGVAVTYPDKGALFIYYLRASGLFGRLTKEDLLQAAKGEGLKGVKAQTKITGVMKLMKAVGFEITGFSDGTWDMEIEDGRSKDKH